MKPSWQWIGSGWVALGLAGFAFGEAIAQSRLRAGDELFSDSPVQQFAIELAAPELEELKRNNRSYVLATITVGNQVLKNVGVRLKGQGSFRPLEDKPSFAVNFDEFSPGQKLYGLTKIMLNNASQDSTLLSECLAASLFRDAGVPVARVTHARVQLNGRDLGFYVLIEAMNKPFLRQYFKNPDGHLYEAYAKDINQTLDQDGGPPSDQADVRALAAAARLPAAERLAHLDRVLDVDRFVSFLAVTMLIAQHDSYPLNRNNYRLYHDPASDRFTMIPHGIDGTFTQTSMPIQPPTRCILTGAVLEAPEGRKLYEERFASLFTNVFKLDVITNRIHAALARLQTAAVDEQERMNLVGPAQSFVRRVKRRQESVQRQLAGVRIAPLVFGPEKTVQLRDWQPEVNAGTAILDKRDHDGLATLYIRTGAGACLASWRQQVVLDPGRYRLTARVRMAKVTPEPGSTLVGAAVRISGARPMTRRLVNDTWSVLEYQIVVQSDQQDVQLVCEFRAAEAEAWFDVGSLKLMKE